MQSKRVVVIGAGFGGLTLAQSLAGEDDLALTVVDRTNHHLFQPLLYQVATAGLAVPDIAAPVRSILRSQANARVLLAEATSIDLERKRVLINTEPSELPFDYLVLALGAKTSYFGHDEWEAHAPGLKSLDDAVEIRTRVLLAFERAEVASDEQERDRLLTFVVIGGGPTGVELAGSIAELSQKVLDRDFRQIRPQQAKIVLVEGAQQILGSFGAALSQSAKEQLEELGVQVLTGSAVQSIDEGAVLLTDGTRLEAETVLWAAGVRATRLAAQVGDRHDRAGRVIVEPDCSVPGHPSVFAIGDMAHFKTVDPKTGEVGVLPGVSPVAMQQARHVAKIIAAEARAPLAADRPAFVYRDKGSMATIGRSRAIAKAGSMEMTGFLAWLAWLFVHLWYLVSFRNRFVVFFNWVWQYVSYKRGARVVMGRAAHSPLGDAHAGGSRPTNEKTAREPGAAWSPTSSPRPVHISE